MSGWWMSPSACLGTVLKIKVATPARNGISDILLAPRPYICSIHYTQALY